MPYIILDVDYNTEAMSDVPCPACGHDSIDSQGIGCMELLGAGVNSAWCPCERPVHVVVKSEDEPIDSIVTLKWLGIEFLESEVTLTEDHQGEDEWTAWHRKWAGRISDETAAKLRDNMMLDNDESEPNLGMLTEEGHMPGWRWQSDGSEWNSGGWTPIIEVSVSMEPTEAEFNANPEHFGFSRIANDA